MKTNVIKKPINLFIALLALASCNPMNTVDMTNWKFTPKDESNIKIGILQPIEHDALSKAREGFINALDTAGYKDGQNITITYSNANGVSSDQNTLAKNLTSSCDLTLGIGTGASQALHSAQINSGSTNPILFTAVTDAVDAELVSSNTNPGGYITGTSDANPVEEQINLIKECLPSATKLGIIYTQSETNSEVQANQAKAAAEGMGLEVKISTCTDSTDLSATARDLCSKVDALYIPTDNNIAANMNTIKAAADTNKILVVCGEEGMLKNGGHVTLSVDYFELGRKCGNIAVSIIKGEKKPNEIPVATMTKEECVYVMSSKNISDTGITLPDSVKTKFTDISAGEN